MHNFSLNFRFLSISFAPWGNLENSPKMVKNPQKWSFLAKIGPKWPKNPKKVEKRQKSLFFDVFGIFQAKSPIWRRCSFLGFFEKCENGQNPGLRPSFFAFLVKIVIFGHFWSFLVIFGVGRPVFGVFGKRAKIDDESESYRKNGGGRLFLEGRFF